MSLLARLKQLVEQPPADTAPAEADRNRLAAALLVEVAYADHSVNEEEERELQRHFQQALALDEDEAAELLREARDEVDHSASLYRFTQPINAHFSMADKTHLLVAMWRVAYADGVLDKYEEGLIRRLAELLHLPHSHFIQAKHAAQYALGLR